MSVRGDTSLPLNSYEPEKCYYIRSHKKCLIATCTSCSIVAALVLLLFVIIHPVCQNHHPDQSSPNCWYSEVLDITYLTLAGIGGIIFLGSICILIRRMCLRCINHQAPLSESEVDTLRIYVKHEQEKQKRIDMFPSLNPYRR